MAGEKIMIIDDNQAFSEELHEILYYCGYDTNVVSESLRALEIARKIKPKAILLDIRMSGVNGFQLAKELKRAKETCNIPIIAMSGYFPIEDRSALLDLSSADERIKKPFGISDLIAKIESVLHKEKIAYVA